MLLEEINSPQDLKKLPQEKLQSVADEIRQLILDTVSKNGGHLASSLGVIELTVVLHYLFNAPEDYIFWDVGHQSYAHKILTGRGKNFSTLRQLSGISGFPNKYESTYDPVTCGHSSTSISAALGVAAARDLNKEKHKVIAVIGDAALAGGMAFEALNHSGHLQKDLIVILNDNEMSIGRSIGAMSKYLNRMMAAPIYNKVRKEVEGLVKRIPRYGFRVYRAARRLEEGLKNLLIPGILFEELGFRYFGPIDGHNIELLLSTIKNVKDLNEPVIIHILTKKGKGYKFAEETPVKFHGIGPFCTDTGKKTDAGCVTFTQVFGEKMVELAKADPRIVAVTAAMCDGTGLEKFAKEFPDRFFDVGIAEEHAVGFAAGLALKGLVPVVAVYSTFLQRAYDQIIHDVALQNSHVVFAIDRAGLVGEDGPTHHGPFDIAYLGAVPNMAIMAPKDCAELGAMLEFAVNHNGPIALRYPRGGAILGTPCGDFAGKNNIVPAECPQQIQLGKSEVLREGKDLAIIALGSMVYPSLEAADDLAKHGINACVINARFAKPFDVEAFLKLSTRISKFLIVEEAIVEGGFGSNIIEFFHSQDPALLINASALPTTEVLHQKGGIKIKLLGLPDMFIEHGPRNVLLERYGLSKDSIIKTARKLLK